MTDRRISGVACSEGEGAAGAEILVLDGDRVAAHTFAGEDGAFRLEVADAPGLRLIARCRRPAAGLAVGPPAEAGAEAVLRLEDVAPVSPVTFTVADRDVAAEHAPILRLVPLALGDLAEDDVQWSLRRVGDRADSAYLALPLEAGSLTCRLQHGRWWFTADLVIVSDVRTRGGEDESHLQAVEARRSDGRPLEAMFDGWVADVDGPSDITLRLAPTA
jgi:hypothetical protein